MIGSQSSIDNWKWSIESAAVGIQLINDQLERENFSNFFKVEPIEFSNYSIILYFFIAIAKVTFKNHSLLNY